MIKLDPQKELLFEKKPKSDLESDIASLGQLEYHEFWGRS